MVSWISRKKKEGIFCIVYFVQREFYRQIGNNNYNIHDK